MPLPEIARRMLVYHWVGRLDAATAQGYFHNQMRQVLPSEVVALAAEFDVFVGTRKINGTDTLYLFLDERGRSFRER